MLSALGAASRRACEAASRVSRAALPGPGDAGSRSSAPAVLRHAPGACRGFYFPRKNWFPWRQRLVHERQAAERKKRHIWPRRVDPDEAPVFQPKLDDGTELKFRDKDIRLGCKRMLDFARLIRRRQLQDAIDWIESLARMKSQPILKLLKRALEEGVKFYNMDPARMYIMDAQPQRGHYVKSLKKHARSNFGVVKSPRNALMVRIRQMPMEEFFHRIYIFNKVPRSMASDMRLALQQNRVSAQMQKEWGPYLCAHSRMFHRKELKWLDSTRQFDYYQARREWIERYKGNLLRGVAEAREARGLPPLAALD